MNRTEHDRPFAVILWNFGCHDSAILAERLSEQFAAERYGGLWVEVNEMDKPYFEGGEAWYADFRATVESGVHMIAILSPAMNRAALEEGKVRGVGLLSELLWFWHKADGNRDFRSKQLIPILLDCTADDL